MLASTGPCSFKDSDRIGVFWTFNDLRREGGFIKRKTKKVLNRLTHDYSVLNRASIPARFIGTPIIVVGK